MALNFDKSTSKESGVKGFFARKKSESLPSNKGVDNSKSTTFEKTVPFENTPEYVDLKVRLHQEIIESINLAAIDKMAREDIQAEIGEVVRSILNQENIPMNVSERHQLTSDVVDELLGLGPIEPLLKDHTVNDILVNTHSQVFVERDGILQLTKVKFRDDAHLMRIIDRIVIQAGRRVDESQPTVDTRLPDGSRVNAVVPPIGVDGPLLSIRKFAEIPFDIEKLIGNGTLTPESAFVLEGIVKCRLNMIISGGTGTGKTTLLNALSRFISNKERIVTIEEPAELQLQQIHVVRMETRPPNIEGKGEIKQRDLVKNALRMRPDRIIVGEVRAGEAFDMLQAMNTGHDGSLTTIHSNSPRDALSRLEQLIGMAGLDLPMRSVRGQIASAIDIVLQIKRFSDGSRKLISVQELTGMEGDVITMHEIFKFEQETVDADGTVVGSFKPTGIRPHFLDIFIANGITISDDMLDNNSFAA